MSEKMYKPVDKEVNTADYQYDPLHMLTSHWKTGDKRNSKTQLWDVVFSPWDTECVAICGGRDLSVVKVSTGDLVMRYTCKNLAYMMYTISWTKMVDNIMLASGSDCGEVRLFHPARKVCFHHWFVNKGIAVYAVKFHCRQPS